MRLIDKDKLLEKVKEIGGIGLRDYVVDLKDIIESEEVDAVPVVRCKDCVYWNDKKIWLDDGTYMDYAPGEYEGTGICFGVTADIGINVGSRCMRREFSNDSWWCSENDYCSYGVRKDVNDENYIQTNKN